MNFLIMRGVPGAGKSTWVHSERRRVEGAGGLLTVVSADHYMRNDRGEYDFRPELLAACHNMCLRSAANLLYNNTQDDIAVVVDNTNVRLFEVAPYYRLAEAFGASVRIVWVHCDPDRAAARCVHGVPAGKIREVAQSFDPLPPWWTVQHVFN